MPAPGEEFLKFLYQRLILRGQRFGLPSDISGIDVGQAQKIICRDTVQAADISEHFMVWLAFFLFPTGNSMLDHTEFFCECLLRIAMILSNLCKPFSNQMDHPL